MTVHACISSPCPTCHPSYLKWCGHQWWDQCYCTSGVPTTTSRFLWKADDYVGRHRPEYVRPWGRA